MKKLIVPFCLAASVSLAVACNSNQSTGSASSDSTGSSTTTSENNAGAATTADTASSANKDASTSDDNKFVMEAASGGLMEVELGKIAETNAASPKVKEFGRMMVTDHTKANTELKAVAAKKNITVPSTPGEDHQKHIDELKAKKGADFDKAYVDMMVDDHKEDISKFQDEANKGNDASIKAFAAKTLPVLNKHLDHINAIHDAMKK